MAARNRQWLANRDPTQAHRHDIRDQAIAQVTALPITVEADTDTHAWTTTLRLSDQFRLTAYEAAYLELAQRRKLPLATLDKQLGAAATALGLLLRGGS